MTPTTQPHAITPSLAQDVVAVQAPTQVWSAADGQARTGVHGIIHSDVRYINSLTLTVGGQQPEHLSTSVEARTACFVSMARNVDDAGKDPHVIVTRTRVVSFGCVNESIEVRNGSKEALRTTVRLDFATEFAPLPSVRAGRPTSATATAQLHGGAVVVESGPRRLTVDVVAGGATAHQLEAESATWQIVVEPGEAWEGAISFIMIDDATALMPPSPRVLGSALSEHSSGTNPDLDRWRTRARDDLNSLMLANDAVPDAVFSAAGAPWYLTLFGRDALWTARLLLPEALPLAHGTLRALAAHQATTYDNAAAAEPGKILHELRDARHSIPREGLEFPAAYYGSVDSTLLWIVLLNEAREAGLPVEAVRELQDNLLAALTWLERDADADGDGFVEYADSSGTGLANQGWKDSSDSVRHADGSVAVGPVALCEVQGYAYQAARAGADLLDMLHLPGGAKWRNWAEDLSDRFRKKFWVERGGMRFPAMALDGQKNPADALTSNIGHLLATGILDSAEELLVRDALMRPDMRSGFGIRTMAASEAAYWPLSYHCGSVWAHDTAICIEGLSAAGFRADARLVAQELLSAAASCEFRVPELFSGDAPTGSGRVTRHPTACVPQAWSAAAAAAVSRALR
ncbi:glycogen debranching N-terminal domain-containing protein [uncultured Schumannella sp.]|uniref:glycogen debranching N-terminal domain-containing protein n=1 Tax=uncultured Schumannella sp. TaxID=1195956 RepID=UPI0025D62DC4|nr:glycogen debranching N-terminal domain-containing protein [uncultured Schumannella sp.]